MVTGRGPLRSPEYSPISSSVSDVRATSSRFHCRPATVLVTRISVVAWAVAIAAAPTSVLPAPQGSTTPPAQLEQRLLGPAALGGVHRHRVLVDARAEHAGELLRLRHLDQHRPVEG